MTTPEPSKRTDRVWQTRILAGSALIAVIAFGAGAYVFTNPNEGDAKDTVVAEAPVTAQQTHNADRQAPPHMLEQGAPFSFADLVEHVSPAVVTISVEREEPIPQFNPEEIPEPFREFFRQYRQGPGMPRVQRGQAMGAGFIIDSEGYIVTNNHVIANGKKITVTLSDKREFTAKQIGVDPGTDVALIKIDGVKNLPRVEFGSDRHLRVGDWVVAVGNPFGLGGTVTAGIVSSIGRDIGNGPYTDYIQIDAPINRGNSGGPTFDLSGKVVGMNSAIFSPTGGSVGIGFAIPATTVQEVVAQLREHGAVARGWLGVQIQNLTPEMAASLGISDANGAIVSRVVPGSPAVSAGFHQGDVVTSMNGRDIEDNRDLTRKVGALRAGERADFTVVRNGKTVKLTAQIAKRDEDKLASLTRGPLAPQKPAQANSLGLRLMALTPEAKRYYSIDDFVSGVLIAEVDPNSEAAAKGLQPGEVISSVSNKPVRTPADIERAIQEARAAKRDSVLFLVSNPQGDRFVALKIAQS
ncbi:MAG: DegQ family serine endoprotease [Alphaproteobacteria bacterium]